MTNTWRSGTEPGYQGQERAHSSCAACMSLSDTDKVTVKVRGQGAAVVYPTHYMRALTQCHLPGAGPPTNTQTRSHTHTHTRTYVQFISANRRMGFRGQHEDPSLNATHAEYSNIITASSLEEMKLFLRSTTRSIFSEHDFCCGTIIAFYPHNSVKPALMHENRLTRLLKVALFLQNMA